MSEPTLAGAIARLRTPESVRQRCAMLLGLAERDALGSFRLHADRLDTAAAYVAGVVSERFPDLRVPPHSRWRHFDAGGVDRWGALAAHFAGDARERARARVDLAVTSVLLDAGAGGAWRYREPGTGTELSRSEGLAVASFHLFATGGYSARSGEPYRADAEALARVEARHLALAFQVSADNPLVGLDGRVGLLRSLGEALTAAPEVFGARSPRVGGLVDTLLGDAGGGKLPAPAILSRVLEGLGGIWPGRESLGGVNLGDVWRHPGIETGDSTTGLVPFHKLSQWLTYSLIEPLEEVGLEVVEVERLTGLAEYRNGGLLIDTGVLEPTAEGWSTRRFEVGSELVVEWRALTVALLDRLAPRVRSALGVEASDLPLASVLEGGTWAAGRRLALERRPGGGPPIRVSSDGTVF